MSNEQKTANMELLQLANGDIVLRRTDDPEDPLVTINFAEHRLPLAEIEKLDIARAMIEAGMARFAELQLMTVEQARRAAQEGRLH